MNITKTINDKTRKMATWLFRFCLFLLYAAIRRRLQLQWISAPPPVIFSGNAFTMRWQVRGCYKIEINNQIMLSGTTNLVQLDPQQTDRSLRLTFYGYKQKVKREYVLKVVNSPLKQDIQLVSKPEQFQVLNTTGRLLSFQMKRLHTFRYALSARTPAIQIKSLLSANRTVDLPHINIQLEPFNPQ